MTFRSPKLLVRWLLLVTACASHVRSFVRRQPHPIRHPSVGSYRRHHRSLRKNYPRGREDDGTMDSSSDDHDLARLSDRFRKFRAAPHRAPRIRRILLLSDLHADYPANQDWLYNMCTSEDAAAGDDSIHSNETMIIIAGDVSHDLDVLRWTFRTLKGRFGEVAFTPGNHELWLDKGKTRRLATKLDSDDADGGRRCRSSGEGDGCATSIEKLEKIFRLCADEDVRVGPVCVGPSSSLWVIPLLSWHHHSFDTEPPIECWGGIPAARRVVADFARTKWPDPLSPLDDSAAEFADGLNDVVLDLDGVDFEDATILTFSHFLPRIELIPEKRYLTLPTLHSCVGSTFLESRVRRLGKCVNKNGSDAGDSHLHAFGHSHLSWDAAIDGVRYVHVPLAYPREWEQRRGSLEIGSMKGAESRDRFPVCVWDISSKGVADDDDDDENDGNDNGFAPNGFPSRWLGGWWSRYYAVMPRQPHRNKELAPWAARTFRRQPGGSIENFVHAEVAKKLKLEPARDGWPAMR